MAASTMILGEIFTTTVLIGVIKRMFPGTFAQIAVEINLFILVSITTIARDGININQVAFQFLAILNPLLHLNFLIAPIAFEFL